MSNDRTLANALASAPSLPSTSAMLGPLVRVQSSDNLSSTVNVAAAAGLHDPTTLRNAHTLHCFCSNHHSFSCPRFSIGNLNLRGNSPNDCKQIGK